MHKDIPQVLTIELLTFLSYLSLYMKFVLIGTVWGTTKSKLAQGKCRLGTVIPKFLLTANFFQSRFYFPYKTMSFFILLLKPVTLEH